MMMQWKDYSLHCGILWCLLRMMFWVVKGKYITTGSWRIGSALSHWWIDAISAIVIGCRLASIKAMNTTLGIRMPVGRTCLAIPLSASRRLLPPCGAPRGHIWQCAPRYKIQSVRVRACVRACVRAGGRAGGRACVREYRQSSWIPILP